MVASGNSARVGLPEVRRALSMVGRLDEVTVIPDGATVTAANRTYEGWCRSGRQPLVPMMQAADLRKCDDLPAADRLNRPPVGCVFAQRQMRTGSMVVIEVRAENPPQVPFVETITWSKQSRLMDPITLSTNVFCQGDRGAVSTSSMPIAFTRDRKTVPYALSRSRTMYRGAVSHGKASRICCATHAAVGFAVTPMCTIRRRS